MSHIVSQLSSVSPSLHCIIATVNTLCHQFTLSGKTHCRAARRLLCWRAKRALDTRNVRARYTKGGETLRQFSWNDAVNETGLSRYKLGKACQHCGIIVEKSQRDRRNVALTFEELSRIREAAHELWPADEKATHLPHTEPSALLGRLDALERRVRALETRQHAPALSRLSVPPLPRETPPARSYVRASLDAQTGDVFPQSLRARGEWVELHSGPGRHYVREWPEARGWQSAADAIRDVRARGYPAFMRGAAETAEDAAESRTE